MTTNEDDFAAHWRDTADWDELHGIEAEPAGKPPMIVVCELHNVIEPFALFQAECEQCLIDHVAASERSRFWRER